MARVPLLDREDLPEKYRHLLSEDALGERNIFRVIGNNPRVLRSYMLYGTTLWEDAGLTAREREIVILTIARTLRSKYEWQQHVVIGGEAGVSDAHVAAIGRDEYDQFGGRDEALVSYAAAFARDEVTEGVHDALTEYCEASTIVGVAMLASHYVATARVLDSLSVSLEGSFVGWYPRE